MDFIAPAGKFCYNIAREKFSVASSNIYIHVFFTEIAIQKEHKESLEKYLEMRERLQNLLEQGEKITPKQWKAEIQSLQAEYDSMEK